jgi:biotin carboxylase
MGEAHKRLIYVGGGREALETLAKAQALGIEIIHFQHKDQFKPALLPFVSRVVLADYRQHALAAALARTLHEHLPLDGVLSLSEDGVVPAAAIGEALGLEWNSLKTAVLLKEKPQMRELLNNKQFSPVAACVCRSAGDLREFLRNCGPPMIVKPTNASGSLGIFRIDDAAQCDEVWERLQALEQTEAMAEEYLDGPEISVESFSFAGKHLILTVTDKLTMENYVEIGHSMPAALPHDFRQQLESFTCTFLNIVGLREGPAHTEIKLTRRGPRIIESHNRPGGDRINELVRLVTGFDMKASTFARMCGMLDEPDFAPRPSAAAAIRFFRPTPGVVRSITGENRVRCCEGFAELAVGVEVGKRVGAITESYDRIGHVIATAGTADEAVQRCERMVGMMVIETAVD